MAANRSSMWWPTLYQLVPKRELNLPGNHIVLGSIKGDQQITNALCRAVGAIPITGDAGEIFRQLFEQVASYLGRRTSHGRINFWHHVTAGWRSTAGVVLDAATVRELVLAITLAERRWDGTKSSDTREFSPTSGLPTSSSDNAKPTATRL